MNFKDPAIEEIEKLLDIDPVHFMSGKVTLCSKFQNNVMYFVSHEKDVHEVTCLHCLDNAMAKSWITFAEYESRVKWAR